MLSLVDRRVAFATLWWEYFALLQKILCSDGRALRFFQSSVVLYDLEIPSTKFVQGFKVSAEELEELKTSYGHDLVGRFEGGEEVPRFSKLCEYVNQFG